MCTEKQPIKYKKNNNAQRYCKPEYVYFFNETIKS